MLPYSQQFGCLHCFCFIIPLSFHYSSSFVQRCKYSSIKHLPVQHPEVKQQRKYWQHQQGKEREKQQKGREMANCQQELPQTTETTFSKTEILSICPTTHRNDSEEVLQDAVCYTQCTHICVCMHTIFQYFIGFKTLL